MLQSIRLQNFRNHADTEVTLGRLTFLVGPNGSGKSGFLRGLHTASRIKRDSTGQVLTGRGRGEFLIRRGQQGFRVILAGDIRGSTWEWECAVEPDESFGGEDAVVTEWRLDGKRYDSGFDLQWKLNAEQSVPAAEIEAQIPETLHYHLSSARLAEPSYCEDVSPQIEPDGYGLATALAYLMTYEPDRFQELEQAVKTVVPAVQRIRVRPARIAILEHRTVSVCDREATVEEERQVSGQELVLDMVGANELPAHAVNEGTLLVIGLLAILISPQPNGILLLDDIDESLHPGAQKQLIHVFCALLKQHEDLQIVLTGRSPYFIDALEPKDVWVMAPSEDGKASVRCLADYPDVDGTLQVLRTGEFLPAL